MSVRSCYLALSYPHDRQRPATRELASEWNTKGNSNKFRKHVKGQASQNFQPHLNTGGLYQPVYDKTPQSNSNLHNISEFSQTTTP